ncbi:DUF3889 domain-containing protein [Paenibacillus antri]|uniref:DUF3889 domain-containing protein n=1 Tax=Paenibacillus antri TaxID=2582848 RepID=A0A5R9GBG5_9BACL|nr:DUF3889 domain-containing protein [Paenibacillus antri]TLS50708.1 DUF3889 domain-containing protein [Paenibacillus antri]
MMNWFALLPLSMSLSLAPPPPFPPAEPVLDPGSCSASFADWIDEAGKAARARYPGATIQDYLYVGCKPLPSLDKEYVYKLWIREGGHRFGAYVAVRVDAAAGRSEGASVEEVGAATAPAYEKWRNLAIAAARAFAPSMTVVDLRPCLCEATAGGEGTLTYKVWLQGGGASKLTDVTIRYRMYTERVTSTNVAVIRSW